MKWHPHLKFALPGVISLFFAAMLGGFMPYYLRVYVYASIALTLALGLLTGQFHKMAGPNKTANQMPPHPTDRQENSQ